MVLQAELRHWMPVWWGSSHFLCWAKCQPAHTQGACPSSCPHFFPQGSVAPVLDYADSHFQTHVFVYFWSTPEQRFLLLCDFLILYTHYYSLYILKMFAYLLLLLCCELYEIKNVILLAQWLLHSRHAQWVYEKEWMGNRERFSSHVLYFWFLLILHSV